MVMIELEMPIQLEELKKSRKSHVWSSSSFHSCYSSVSYEWWWKTMRLKTKAKEWSWSRFRTSKSRWRKSSFKKQGDRSENREDESEKRIEKMREVESGSGERIEQKSSCWQWCAWVARSDRTLVDWLEWVRVLSRRRGEQGGWMNEWDGKNRERKRNRVKEREMGVDAQLGRERIQGFKLSLVVCVRSSFPFSFLHHFSLIPHLFTIIPPPGFPSCIRQSVLLTLTPFPIIFFQ